MSPIGRVFPQIYSVSFYNFVLKTLAILAYAIILSVIFGFFISESESGRDSQVEIGGNGGSSGHALMASVHEASSSRNEIVITRSDVKRAQAGPVQAVQVTNEKLQETDLSQGTPDILFQE
ncbi:MAG: hypothetical protein ACYTGH_17030 [Planctomycetota bacterium]|jgi:hypothetical protein